MKEGIEGNKTARENSAKKTARENAAKKIAREKLAKKAARKNSANGKVFGKKGKDYGEVKG